MIPVVRLSEEALRLRPLKVRPEDLVLRIPVYVGPTGTVLHEGHPYSMPPEAISMPATLYLYADRVRIVAGRYEVLHPRKFLPREGSTLAEHRAAMVGAVSGKRGKRYLKRQQLLELGEPALLYLTEIVHRRPRQWFSTSIGFTTSCRARGLRFFVELCKRGSKSKSSVPPTSSVFCNAPWSSRRSSYEKTQLRNIREVHRWPQRISPT